MSKRIRRLMARDEVVLWEGRSEMSYAEYKAVTKASAKEFIGHDPVFFLNAMYAVFAAVALVAALLMENADQRGGPLLLAGLFAFIAWVLPASIRRTFQTSRYWLTDRQLIEISRGVLFRSWKAIAIADIIHAAIEPGSNDFIAWGRYEDFKRKPRPDLQARRMRKASVKKYGPDSVSAHDSISVFRLSDAQTLVEMLQARNPSLKEGAPGPET